jgi:branched-chain amino acid transport system ATP-binding protein
MINGLHRPDAGEIRFGGRRIDREPPHRITRAGIGRTFQISRQLSDLTVLGNVVVQAPARGLSGLVRNAILGPERAKAMELSASRTLPGCRPRSCPMGRRS